jgi:formate dehydrogenase subunit delta
LIDQPGEMQMANGESADREVSHLVSMANDIAANLGFHSDPKERIADHINRFWTPRMRSLLLEYAAAGGQDLSEASLAALGLLKE